MVPQLWFMFFGSLPVLYQFFTSSLPVLYQLVFGRPRFRFPFRVQWITTLVMELGIIAHHVPNPAPSLPGDDGGLVSVYE